jgi:hypothetical protein
MKNNKENQSWDYLNILTKSEIIDFLKREYFFNSPTKIKVGFYKWERRVHELQIEMDEHLADDTNHILAKEIDRLAVLFNDEKDSVKKWDLFEKRSKLIEKFKKHEEKYQAIYKKQEDNDKYYDSLTKNQ